MLASEPGRVWTVAEAKAKLSEVLRLAETEGSATHRRAEALRRRARKRLAGTRIRLPRMPMGRWLIENMPRGTNLEIPDRGSTRKVPFIDEDDE